ncbi:phage baseplate assembly protein V [Geodermatophilus sp. SYSU D01105]
MSVTTAAGAAARRSRKQYLGKYRGVVLQNFDPMGIGRLQVQVIGVFTVTSSWAMPSFPVAGLQTGAVAVPPIGAGVWVEFERGDPDYPIWTGCYFSSRTEVPPLVQLVPPPIPAMTLQTPLKNAVQVSDAPPTPVTGGVVLRNTTGASIVVNDSGIYISDGKGGAITIIAGVVTVNAGALIVK